MEDEEGEKVSGCEVAELRLQVESLKEELKECKAELAKLQKQLSHSERLQRSTESYNDDLRKQVDQLSAEIHEWKKKTKDKVHTETQTEEYVWTDTDYYNYYYGDYYQNTEAADSQESLGATQAADATGGGDSAEVATVEQADATAATAADVSTQPDSSVVATAEGDAASIADMLRATAEEAMTQTGFVFDETTGMYYDHSTGFYYDSVSQLYYDGTTGIYYYYDAESGRYQFHSKVDVSAVHTGDQDDCVTEKKGRWFKRGVKKTSAYNDKEYAFDEVKSEEEEQQSKRTTESRKTRRRSRSHESRERDSKRRGERDKSSSKRKKHKSGSSHDEKRRSKKKKKRSKSSSSRKKERRSPTRGGDLEGNSEAEEGELTESEKEQWESPPSVSPSRSSPCNHSPESEMETQCRAELWPPCVRVTVVRSPVLQVGTLFIITADSAATIGREKDMDHAIRIPEMGVSKLHAEVYFDQQQQSYMLVDQGSQNGTVINGNRILQPKTKCEPHPLTHGDEVKMGDTVLSFHIHAGTDTCDGCEPGQIMAHLSKHKREDTPGPTLTKEDKEVLRQKELKSMKAKYGLQVNGSICMRPFSLPFRLLSCFSSRQSNEFEEGKALRNPKYRDRAESRRQTVGSEGLFQQDDAPASVHVEISEVNKGRKMLEKMGWKKGEGLGKEGTGMKDPIQLQIRKAQSGLGACGTMSVDDASLTRSKSQKNWEKARERFADSCQVDTPSPKTQCVSPKAWVKAEPEIADSHADVDPETQS
ncbi:angiogenic factor with G patch and FHA domains 1 isoform X2 [Hippocampus comes]|uniref:angiogenic factor with G patch and FHA domains 1 isoform X2 n=1 Tax=Hippocampus comes TaxID=109280 RepID=UPI00094EA470|nr:PREDICTED: angiogenic factor with G patch and FHA domains 1 isoform X2 [Hippocampus comes]